jgi:hypothetical protein
VGKTTSTHFAKQTFEQNITFSCEELQNVKNTLQSYQNKDKKKDASSFPKRRLQVHQKMMGILKKLKNS